MTDRFDLFEQNSILNEISNRKVKVSRGFLPIRRRDTVWTKFYNSKIKLANTFYVPKLGANLLSILRFYRKEYTGSFDYKDFAIYPAD
jgi:hypothetical protein